jgi:hypothetical protein
VEAALLKELEAATAEGVVLRTRLLAGAPKLLALHRRELPQRDDLCGAFCAALALRAAGIEQHDGEPLDQDTVALQAGSIVSRRPDPSILPEGEGGRRDYRLQIPLIDDGKLSGTTAAGVMRALERIGAGRLEPIALSGPWTCATLDALFDCCESFERPVALLANHATRHLWGSAATTDELVDHLLHGTIEGPEPDWDVGHFACVVARTEGPHASLYALADTYPALGRGGVHLQPRERLAAALARPDMPAGGMIVLVDVRDAPELRAAAAAAGLEEGLWDNGSVEADEAG